MRNILTLLDVALIAATLLVKNPKEQLYTSIGPVL
jgi:hypothetical protein